MTASRPRSTRTRWCFCSSAFASPGRSRMQRWLAEEAAYLELWRRHYSLPPRDTIPDRRAAGAAAIS